MPVIRLLGRLGFAGLFLAVLHLFPTSAEGAPPSTPVIALFTDYGWEDPYVAQIKGAILTINPSARIMDLTHTVSPFDIAEGSYLLDQSAEEFPPGTIFVAVVDPQVGADHAPILIESGKGKFYIGPDNGLFTDVINREGATRIWKLDHTEFFRAGTYPHSFHGRDIFGPVAAHLAAGIDPDQLGTPLKTPTLLPSKEPNISGAIISVEVLHVDRYGNLILNLSSESEPAAKLKQGTLVRISVGKESYSAPLVGTYGDVQKGHLALLYGGSGLLEIAMNQGSAAKELKAEASTMILLKP